MYQEGDLQRIIIFLSVFAAVVALYVVFSIALSRIFKKASLPGWMGFVPYLSTVKLFDISWEAKYGLIFLGIVTFSSFFCSRIFRNTYCYNERVFRRLIHKYVFETCKSVWKKRKIRSGTDTFTVCIPYDTGI